MLSEKRDKPKKLKKPNKPEKPDGTVQYRPYPDLQESQYHPPYSVADSQGKIGKGL